MDFAVKISDISDKKLFSILEEKFQISTNEHSKICQTIKEICEAKGNFVKGSRTHKVSLNSQDFWFEDPEEIHNAIKHLQKLDIHLTNMTKLMLVNQLNIGPTGALDVIKVQLKLLQNIESAGIAIKGVNTQEVYLIDEIIQKQPNLIARTTNDKCIKKYMTEQSFSRELNFAQHYNYCSFMPKIIDFNKRDHLVVMPWYDKIDIENGPDISVNIKSALNTMKDEGIQHNDISIFDEIFYTNGKITITDWEQGTVGTEISTKIRQYEDGCLSDAYSFLYGDHLLEYEPIVTLTRTDVSPEGREVAYFKVAAYAIKRTDLTKFERFKKLIDYDLYQDLQTADAIFISLIFKKNTCKLFDQFKPIQGLADVKRALDAQGIFKRDYMLKLWRYWWQKKILIK